MIKNQFLWWMILFLFGCSSTQKVTQKTTSTGQVKYAIKVDAKEGMPVTAESFGSEALVHFNEQYVHFKKLDGQGADQAFQMVDVATGTEMNYLNFRGKKYLMTTTPDMLPPIGALTFQEERKTIMGLECQKATATMGEGMIEAWFTKSIGVNYCPYVKADGFVLQYSLPMPFGVVTYTATEINLNETDLALLTPPSDYKKVTMKELQTELSGVPEPTISNGTEAPNFIAKDLLGKMVDLNDLKGKVILLNFWFINCPPCRMEMPDLNELKNEYKDQDVEFIGITFDQPNQINQFLKKTPFEFQIIPNAQPIIDDYQIGGFPTSIVIGRDGKVVDSKMGGSFNIKDELKVFIEKALKQ